MQGLAGALEMGSSWALLGKEPPAAPSSQRYPGPSLLRVCSVSPGLPRAAPGPLVACSPVLEPILRVLQPGPQVPDAHFLLLQWGQVLLGGRWLDAMVVAAQRVLHGAPARGLSSARRDKRGARHRPCASREQEDASLTTLVPHHQRAPGQASWIGPVWA